ncbi:MAG TPA: TIR domain-containing protein [Stellaceae bacterium]|nr:TIR domain-containing protein [Stellaceae bacterium]
MGILFISHSSRNNEPAIRLNDWLRKNGWGQVFLDLDPTQGLAPGQLWQQELKKAGERCTAVLVLVSPDWIASRWCQAEFLLAEQLGKLIFPVLVAPTPAADLPPEILGKYQFADLSTPDKEAEGLQRLSIGLKRAGLDPKSFEWPPSGEPHRPIYRGLEALEEQDAAIFFGRDAMITKGLDALRRMRDGAPERILVILGASGAGKSSFLKAGLVARLRRDEEHFLVPPVIRPERAALTGVDGLAAALARDPAGLNGPEDVAAALAALRRPAMDRLARVAGDGQHPQAPTIVLMVDQAEELFAAENSEAAPALDLLAAAVRADPDTIIVATIRSESFARLQSEPRLAEIPRLPFDLTPIPSGAFKEIIEGPARLADPPLAVEPALTDRLLEDLDASDGLPLLALTLERLTARSRGRGRLTLADYDAMGGLRGAVAAAVEAAFAEAVRDPALPNERVELESLARAAFIPALVQLDDATAVPKRRVERLSALPEPTRPLVRHLIDQRLLVSDRRILDGTETEVVEVTHEAILRQWPALRGWIEEARDALRTLDTVRAAAQERRAHRDGAGGGWLVHRGDRLAEAEALLARPDFAAALGSVERGYLAECRAADNAERQREQRQLARTRRLQAAIGALIGVAAVLVLAAGAGTTRLLAGLAQRSSDTLASLARTASENGQYDRAARYALAGIAGADWPLIGHRSAAAEAELAGALYSSSAIAALRGHTSDVNHAAFSPDGTRVVTASFDRTARIWDAATGREMTVLRGHEGWLFTALYSPDGTHIVTASQDKTARIWDAATGREVMTLRGHDGWVDFAAYSPDGTRIVTASGDRTIRIWEAATGREIAVLRGHEARVSSAVFSPDGTRIVSASEDQTVRIWDAASGREINVLRGHTDFVISARFSPDGTRIISACEDRTARIWDAQTGRQLAVLEGHTGVVDGAAYSPDGTRIVTASGDMTVRIWDAADNRQIAILQGHEDEIESVAYSPDGKRIVTASVDGTARIWSVSGRPEIATLEGHDGWVFGVSFSPDGTRVATASGDRTARVWDAASGRETAVLKGHGDMVLMATFSPDGSRIATASEDRTARIWDAVSGSQIAILRGHEDIVSGATFSPDGTRVVTASADKTARIWGAATGQELGVLRGHTEKVNSAVYSPDGTRILTSSNDGSVRLWDALSGREVAALPRQDRFVRAAGFSADGRRIVTGSEDGTARVWDADSRRELLVLRGHEGDVARAVFSRDGKRIFTLSGSDRTVRIWDADSGREDAVLRWNELIVLGIAVSPDGTRAVSALSDRTARIWPVTPVLLAGRDELAREACTTRLAAGLHEFSAGELRAAAVLDPDVDADACNPPSLRGRLRQIFLAAAP